MITWRFADVNKLPEESGIYMILNILNNHKYVGSTNNFKRRLTRHRGELRKDKHHSTYLQRAYNKYGEDKFIIYILERCSPIKDTLIYLEQKYLDLNPEYNISKTASHPSNTGHKMPEQAKKRLHDLYYGKKRDPKIVDKATKNRIGKGCKNVYCYNKDGEFIGCFLNSKQAVKLLNLNITPGTINKCCTGLCKSIGGFIWSYDYRTDISYKKDNAKRTKIVRIYKNGIEKIYSSITEAAKDTGNINNKSAISDCLRGRRKTAYGSKWRYYND